MDYNELIEAFAASLGIEGAQTEGGAAAFDIDGMKVSIFHDDAADTVMIYGEIGQPPSDDDRSFGPAMLKANHLFGGTGGTRRRDGRASARLPQGSRQASRLEPSDRRDGGRSLRKRGLQLVRPDDKVMAGFGFVRNVRS